MAVAAVVLAACATRPTPSRPAAAPTTAIPAVTRGEFTLAANKLDTWNAVGQIVVRTPGVAYQGRSQMLDLYTVRYRSESFLLITRALLLSDIIKETTTQVTARTIDGKPIDSDAAAELLALLQRELPAQIEKDRAIQAAGAAAKAKAKKSKPKSHKKR